MWCVIPAAGKGSRLYPITRTIPKPLIDLCGRTLLERLLDNISQSATNICLIVNQSGHLIRNVIGKSFCGIPVHYVNQKQPLGIANAVLQARGLVKGDFILLMGDTYFAEPLLSYICAWNPSGASGAILVEDTKEPLHGEVGRVAVEGDRVVQITKGEFRSGLDYRICGMMILPEEIFGASEALKSSTIVEDEIETAVQSLIDMGIEFMPILYNGWRRNINTDNDLKEVLRRLSGPSEQKDKIT
jgi:glucose-1-phosphate thymidylyltransferase